MRTRRTPEDLGWRAEDLRSAYAVDGSGPYRYAPDGSGPFSYDTDGSGPWLVGPTPGRGSTRFAPRARRTVRGPGRIRAAVASGALAVVLAVGSVTIVAHAAPVHGGVEATAVHGTSNDGT